MQQFGRRRLHAVREQVVHFSHMLYQILNYFNNFFHIIITDLTYNIDLSNKDLHESHFYHSSLIYYQVLIVHHGKTGSISAGLILNCIQLTLQNTVSVQ